MQADPLPTALWSRRFQNWKLRFNNCPIRRCQMTDLQVQKWHWKRSRQRQSRRANKQPRIQLSQPRHEWELQQVNPLPHNQQQHKPELLNQQQHKPELLNQQQHKPELHNQQQHKPELHNPLSHNLAWYAQVAHYRCAPLACRWHLHSLITNGPHLPITR